MRKKPAPAPVADQPDEEARIEYVSLDVLARAKRNPKLHDLPTIRASILRHGFVAPLVENAKTGRLVAGHGRLEAVLAIKAETPDQPPRRVKVVDGAWMLPVVRGVSFPNEQAAEEYLLADNRLVELGGWDEAALAPIFEDFGKLGADALAAIGWSTDEMAAVIAAVAKRTQAPEAFPDINPGNVTTQYCCPKCRYVWSGSPDPAKAIVVDEPAADEPAA